MNVFQPLIDTNLHPSFFEYTNQQEPPQRTLESIEKSRKVLIDNSEPRYKDFPLTSNDKFDTPYSSILEGIQELTPFSKLFFSKENLKNIQNLIRYRIYINSNKNYIIGNQNDTELLIVMRSIYLQYSRLPACSSDYKSSIKKLNQLVLNNVLPSIMSNIEQYKGYLKDASNNPVPLSRPVYTSSSGTKLNRSITDVLIGNDIN